MLTGHHEVMFPLLAAAIREELAGATSKPAARSTDAVAIASAQNFFPRRLRANRDSHRLRLSRSLCRSDERCASPPSRPTRPSSTSPMASRRSRWPPERSRLRRAGDSSRSGRSSWRSSIPASAPRDSRSRSKPRAGARFVGPDNGVMYLAAKDAGIQPHRRVARSEVSPQECQLDLPRPRYLCARGGVAVRQERRSPRSARRFRQ